MGDDVEALLRKKAMRERRAREAAERLAEERTRALYYANVELQALNETMQEKIRARTEELESARDAAVAADAAKSTFLASMSHEIRTPMNGVMGMLELLGDARLSDELNDYVHRARRSAESLLSLLNDILDLSKVEAGSMELERVEFQLNPILTDVEYLFEEQAQVKGITLELHGMPDDDRVVGDPARLRQVITNLVSNAVKFTSKGSVMIRAQIHQVGDNHSLTLSVKDSGVGIPADRLQGIFNPFEQGDVSTNRRFGGTGLGLSITQRLVELMGGTIDVTSEVGKGSEFTVTMPYHLGSAIPLKVSTMPVPGAKGALAGRVLVVDDDESNRFIATRFLEKAGHETAAVSSGEEALALLEREEFDLILMDCQMPGMDGFEATRRIRASQLADRTPILALTANALETEAQACLEAGMDAHVSKPIRRHHFLKTVGNWLSVHT